MIKDKDFNKMVNDIQKKIEHYEETDFSKKVIDEYRNPNNFYAIENPDVTGEIKGPCGDTMKIMLNVENDIVVDIGFLTDGCCTSIACGSMLTKMVQGKTLKEVSIITSEKLNDALDGLPENHVHCTVLAVNTLKKALNKFDRR